jgi:hypothetical protein
MSLVLGMASSHFPSLFQDTYRGWQHMWKVLSSTTPQPPETALEDEACVQQFIERRNRAFGALRQSFEAHAPEALIVIAGDQSEWFDPSHSPGMLMYTGHDDIEGFHMSGALDGEVPLNYWEHPDQFGLKLKVDPDLAQHLHRHLVRAGFDVSQSTRIDPQGRDKSRKAPHALARPLPQFMPKLDVPVIPVMIKTIEKTALLTGERCMALGREIARACAALPQRIAIYGSGGMSHDPAGPRSGWVDERMDHWVLDCLARGDLIALENLFSFRSHATDAGTGELRTWLVAAGAMDAAVPGIRSETIDYFAARKGTTGAGWVLWDSAKEMKEIRR